MSYKVVFEFDPFEMANVDKPTSRRDRAEALKEIAEYVKTEMLQHYGEATSPASGGRWKASLSPAYEKIKEDISGSNEANMELYGDMLDALEVRIDGNRIKVGWFSGEQAAKAYGHQTGYEGHPTIKRGPVRQLVPEEGGKFKSPIVRGMKEIAEAFLEDEE